MRRSSLVALAGMLFWAPSSQATSPPNLPEALRAQQTQALRHPTDPEILNDLGNLLVLARSLDEAEDTYSRSLEIDPGNTTTRYNLALVLMEQGNTRQATKELRHVLELDPYHAWSLYQLGTLSASTGHRRKAVEYYTEALALRPELASPAYNPHIIENRYVTEAHLRLYLRKAEAAQSPRLYQRPGEVAELLLPSAAQESTTTPFVEVVTDPDVLPEEQRITWPDEPPARLDSASAGAEATRLGAAEPAASWEPDSEPTHDAGDRESEDLPPSSEQSSVGESSRVLSQEDLEPTNVGQGVGYVGSPGQSTSSRSRTRPGGTSTYPRTTTPGSGSPSSAAPPQPQSTPGSDSFVPSVGSTGRLDLELLTEESSPALAPGS